MRTWVIFGVIICLLGSLIIFEAKLNREFFSESTLIIDSAKDKILNKESPVSELDNLKTIWNRNKTSFFIFYSHNIIGSFEESLSKACISAYMNDEKMINYKIDELKNVNDMFRDYHSFRIGNVF